MAMQTAPGPKGAALIRAAARLAGRDLLQELQRATAEFGPFVHFSLPTHELLVVSEPEAVRHVLLENAKNYDKSERIKELRYVLGNGLLTSEGDFWLRHRRLAQPAFRHDRIAGLAETMVRCTGAALGQMERAAARGESLDISELLSTLTLEIVGRCLFSVSLESHAREIGPALIDVLRQTSFRARSMLKLPRFIPTPGELRYRRGEQALKRIMRDLVRARIASGESKPDLLGMLLEARDDEGQGMSEAQLCDETMTLILAGHETTANALAWTFYLLARSPEVEHRLVAEIEAATQGRPVAAEHLPRLRYVRQVVQEGMRIYPPAWTMIRCAINEDEVGGYRVPARGMVLISPFLLHRNAQHWENPERFDPERFSPEAEKARARFSYLPFGGGPRICIGNEFALMEAQLILSSIVQRFSLQLVAGQRVEMEPVVTLRPRFGVQVTPQFRATPGEFAKSAKSLAAT